MPMYEMYGNSCNPFPTKSCRLMETLKGSRSGEWDNLVMNLKDNCTLATMEQKEDVVSSSLKQNVISLRDPIMLGCHMQKFMTFPRG